MLCVFGTALAAFKGCWLGCVVTCRGAGMTAAVFSPFVQCATGGDGLLDFGFSGSAMRTLPAPDGRNCGCTPAEAICSSPSAAAGFGVEPGRSRQVTRSPVRKSTSSAQVIQIRRQLVTVCPSIAGGWELESATMTDLPCLSPGHRDRNLPGHGLKALPALFP